MEITCCDKCGKELLGDLMLKMIKIANEEYHLCNDCMKKFKEFFNDYKQGILEKKQEEEISDYKAKEDLKASI